MLDILYEKSIQNRKKIQEHFGNLQESIDMEHVKKEYETYTFTKEKQNKSFISTDGSSNSKRFMSDFIYALASQTILSLPSESIIKDTSSGEINYTSTVNSSNINRKLSRQMNILELKTMIKTMQNHNDQIDYILIDGNLSGTLKNYQIPNLNQSEENLSQLEYQLKQYIISIEKKLKDNTFEVEISSITRENEIYKTISDYISTYEEYEKLKDIILDYVDALEQLSCIKYLMDKYHEKIIGVSKTSSTNHIFKKNIPDAAVLEYSTKSAGYTKIRKPIVNKKLVRKVNNRDYLSVDYPLYNDEIIQYQYLIFFIRLEERKNILKIELPLKEEKNLEKYDNEKIKEIFEDLYSISIDGYPYILKKAHHEVVIKNKNLDKIIDKYELKLKNGRDML